MHFHHQLPKYAATSEKFLNLLRLRPGKYLLHYGFQTPCLKPRHHLSPATLLLVFLSLVKHTHPADSLTLLGQLLFLIRGPISTGATHRHNPTTLGERT